jgi:hypothetical protein
MPYQFTPFLGTNDFRKISSINRRTEHAILVNPNIQDMRKQYALKQLDKFGTVEYDGTGLLHIVIIGNFNMSQFMPYVLEFQNLKALTITEHVHIKSRITGSIPYEIGLLRNLVYLKICGHMVTTIPKSMVCMTTLNSLNLWNNVILGQIPDEFFNPENNILKRNNCIIKIWKRAIGGRLYHHSGSIINYNKKHNESTWFLDEDGQNEFDYDNYNSLPLLIRSNAAAYNMDILFRHHMAQL